MSTPSARGVQGRASRLPHIEHGMTPAVELDGDPFAAGPSLHVLHKGPEHRGSNDDVHNRPQRPAEVVERADRTNAQSGAPSVVGKPLGISPPEMHGGFDDLLPTPSSSKDLNPLHLGAGSSPRISSHASNSPSRERPSLPSLDVRAAVQEPMRRNSGKRRDVQEIDSSKRPTSPHITIATPTSARFHHNHQQIRGPPERAYSLPASQERRSAASSPHEGPIKTPPRQNSFKDLAAQAAHSVVDAMTGGRTTPSTALSNANSVHRPGSASAGNRRRSENTSAPHEYGHNAALESFVEGDGSHDIYDDEEGKGHGARRFSGGNHSGRWTPTIFSSIIKKAEGRFSPVNPFVTTHVPFVHAHHGTGSDAYPQKVSSPGKSPVALASEPETLTEDDIKHVESDRKTPARYRPVSNGSPATSLAHTQAVSTNPKTSHTQAHPLSHAHKISVSSTSNSSHSITMSSPTMSAHSRHSSVHASVKSQISPVLGGTRITSASASSHSPLVIPQARRGAINLRPIRRRKQNAIANRQAAPAIPPHVHVVHLLRRVCTALLHPLGTCTHMKRSCFSTLHGVDQAFRDPRTGTRVWRPLWLHAYIPLLIWLAVSLSSTFTVLIWHEQVFQGLDRLSGTLQGMGMRGRLILGSLIFLTTFPPLPLYSTLIILCGFTFGLWQGFIISYIAALAGAITVFLLSRSLLKSWMLNLLNKSGGLKRVVRAIEKRPKLLFLVRLAPYPYNLMNTLLASSPTLTLKTYTTCTALALPKLLVHCGLGTTIKNFAAYNGVARVSESDEILSSGSPTSAAIIDGTSSGDATASETAELIKHIFGFAGVGLCIGIFIYLFRVARRAVDEELDEDDEELENDYELVFSDDEDEMRQTHGELGPDSHHATNDFVIDDNDEVYDQPRSTTAGRSMRDRPDAASTQREKKGETSMDSMSRLSAIPPRSASTHRFAAGDGTTPMYIVPPQIEGMPYDNGSDVGRSYFASRAGGPLQHHHSTSSKGYSSSNLSDSQTSLADSIAEMEKHASLMETIPSARAQRGVPLDALNAKTRSHAA